jgi:hypothetical protein
MVFRDDSADLTGMGLFSFLVLLAKPFASGSAVLPFGGPCHRTHRSNETAHSHSRSPRCDLRVTRVVVDVTMTNQ